MLQRKLRPSLRVESLESRNLLAAAVALTTSNELLRFDTDTPDAVSMVAITGLSMGEQVLGIDHRPATGELFALSSANRLLTLNALTGAATPVGAGFGVALNGTKFGIDFNPSVDRLRVVSDAEQNLRLNPDTGGLAAVDTSLSYGFRPPFAFEDPTIVAAAYVNNLPGASTLLFVLDSRLNALIFQGPPNDGALNPVAGLGFPTTDLIGFDVLTADGQDMAFVSVSDGGVTQLYQIQVIDYQFTSLGALGTDRAILDLAMVLGAPSSPSSDGSSGFFSDVVTGLTLVDAVVTPVASLVLETTSQPSRPAQEAVFAVPPVETTEPLRMTTVSRAGVDELFTLGF